MLGSETRSGSGPCPPRRETPWSSLELSSRTNGPGRAYYPIGLSTWRGTQLHVLLLIDVNGGFSGGVGGVL